MLKKYHLFILIGLLAFASCREGGCNVVDNIVVHSVFLFGEFPNLRVQGGYALGKPNQGGVAGIIVVNVGNNRFVAYDRASPVNPGKRCAVEIQDGGLVAIDPCSGAKWILTNGSPADIAECPLKPYRASLQQGGNAVIVTN